MRDRVRRKEGRGTKSGTARNEGWRNGRKRERERVEIKADGWTDRLTDSGSPTNGLSANC